MSKFSRSSLFAALVVGLFAASASAQGLPEYKAVKGISGNIKSVGSDTMNNMMALWAEGFKKFYPSVQVEIEGKGSSTAPPALIEGISNFGPMSRKMKEKEIDAFEEKFGYKPTPLATSIDMLAVYVHKDNPLKGLSLAQVDAIFSKTRKLNHPQDVQTWGPLGLKGDWSDKPISLYGRNAASGTYGYFKEIALGKGDYRDSVKEQAGSSAVVQGVASEKFGIGYSGIGYKTADVRALPLSRETGGELVAAVAENAYNGSYPLARPLLLYVNKKPNEDLDPLRREFIKFIFSRQGQEAVEKDGYFPISGAAAKKMLASCGIDDVEFPSKN